MKTIKLKDILIQNPGTTHGKHTYIDWEADIELYVDEVYQGEEHFSAYYIIVFQDEDGTYWGFEDWQNSEGDNGISEEYSYSSDAKIDIFEMEQQLKVTYRRKEA